jgi:hypothetical protein
MNPNYLLKHELEYQFRVRGIPCFGEVILFSHAGYGEARGSHHGCFRYESTSFTDESCCGRDELVCELCVRGVPCFGVVILFSHAGYGEACGSHLGVLLWEHIYCWNLQALCKYLTVYVGVFRNSGLLFFFAVYLAILHLFVFVFVIVCMLLNKITYFVLYVLSVGSHTIYWYQSKVTQVYYIFFPAGKETCVGNLVKM